MSWAELLCRDEIVTLPWTGGRAVADRQRRYRIVGALPDEHGWHRFEVGGSRRAKWVGAGELDFDFGERRDAVAGYLLGDRMIEDTVSVRLDVCAVLKSGRRVHLIEPGLGRFARGLAARNTDGRLIFVREEFPLGPEPQVLDAYQDRAMSLASVRGVTPALHLAFLWHTYRRRLADERRERLERLAREAEERAAREAAYRGALGSAALRRRLAATDFEAAARAALALGGAELLDCLPSRSHAERIVQFRFRNRRFECLVNKQTLRVIDSGICLVDHATNERGDTLFTLESLVAVIDEAIRTDQLVVFRHAH